MRAAQIKSYGGVEVIEINENAPAPVPTENQILVEVYAAGVNPVDWKIREGFLKEMIPLNFPATLGGDFAGKVSALGEGVVDFQIGDEVFGQASTMHGGSFAEFAIASTSSASSKPKNTDYTTAAALPLAGVSAVQAVIDHINLASGQKILIHGGAGGIGSMAIQIAKNLGAFVATTVSANDVDYAKKMGADSVIDYKSQKFEDVVKDFDAVFDTAGGDNPKRSVSIIKKGGILVSMAGGVDEELAKTHGITAISQMTQITKARLEKLSEFIDSGVKVNVEKIFPLSEAAQALDYLKNTPPKGKIVLKIKD